MEFECSCRHFTNNFEKTASNGMCWCLASCLFQKLSFVHKRLMYLYRPQQAFLMRLENPTTKLSSQVKSVIMTKKKSPQVYLRNLSHHSELHQKNHQSLEMGNSWPTYTVSFSATPGSYMFMSSCTWAHPFSPSSLKSPCLHPTPSLSCHWWLVDMAPPKRSCK